MLHSALLVRESDRLAQDIKGGFVEESRERIQLDEEDPEMFGYFVEYLYRSEWLAEEDVQRDSDYVVLARLYALGERLQARQLQLATLRKFTSSFGAGKSLPDQCICDLLDVACTELPDRPGEDPLRAQIFWYAASQLGRLQGYDYFLRLLETNGDLGRHLCVWAGDTPKSQPAKPSEKLPSRFEPESIY